MIGVTEGVRQMSRIDDIADERYVIDLTFRYSFTAAELSQ
jgi:hypothetical protein